LQDRHSAAARTRCASRTIADSKIVLLQMAAGPYPEETRMLGAWALRSMLRLMRQAAPCVLVCDEFARLGVQGRAALELLAMGREFGKPVVLLTQGPSDFGEMGHHALDRAAREAAWLLVFRQGTRDSDTASRLLGVRWVENRSWSTGQTGDREHLRLIEQPYVSASVLEDLPTAKAYLRVPSIDGRRTRVEPVRIARPLLVRGIPAVPDVPREGSGAQRRDGIPTFGAAQVPPTVPHSAQPELDEDLERVLERLEREGERDGECRLWPASGTNGDGYAKTTIQGRTVTVYIDLAV
jgi:hypothetical protein